jgi:hypothetical protein
MRIALFAALLAQISSLTPRPGHAAVAASPLDVGAKPGAKVSLFVDVTPKPAVFASRARVEGLHCGGWKSRRVADRGRQAGVPQVRDDVVADEQVPVFQPFRLTQGVTLDKSLKPGATVTVAGTVTYQACDDRVCYPPESAPVAWTVTVK